MVRQSQITLRVPNSAAADKKLNWIKSTDQRFPSYNYFEMHPELTLAWFDTQMK
jgi:hypothetical protein